MPNKGEFIREQVCIVFYEILHRPGRWSWLYSNGVLSRIGSTIAIGGHGYCWWSFRRFFIPDFAGSRWRSNLIVYQLLLGHAFVLAELTRLKDEITDNYIPDMFRYYYFRLDLLQKLLLVGWFPGGGAFDHLIKNHSQCEDIGLAGIVAFLEWLRRHVKWCPYIDPILEPITWLHRETEIRDFPLVA